MKGRVGRLGVGALLVALAAGCGGAETQAAEASEDQAVAAARAAESRDAARGVVSLADLDRGVTVARAIRAMPDAADSILAAHGLTRSGLDSLMFAIAADSALARAYAEAIK